MRHLLDGDPASNTLSWRWVAGLHTHGKHYVAVPQNIAKFTDQRFTPSDTELAQNPEPLTEAFDYGPALPARAITPFDPSKPSALLITLEDGTPETLGLPIDAFRAVGTLCVSPPNIAAPVAQFDQAALAEAGQRMRGDGVVTLDPRNPDALAEWAHAVGAEQIVTSYLPIGPTHSWLEASRPRLDAAGIRLAEVQRAWDSAVWPYATAGFFKVKKKIPQILQALSQGGSPAC